MSYTSIAITAPNTAKEGDLVSMSTLITNISAYNVMFRVVLYAIRDIYAVPTTEETIGSLEVAINSGQSQLVSGTFIMPAWDTNVLIMVRRFIDYWDFDNYATMVVSLVGGLTGSIVKKELEYAGITKTIPVAGVPKDVRAKLHIWGKNGMSISQGMGIRWIITDPDGVVIENYEDWGGTIGAGQDHEFISSGQFNLDKVGEYAVSVDLLMGTESNPVVVEPFAGGLCTVATEGEIIYKKLEYTGGSNGTVPVAGVPIDVKAKLHVWGQNNMGISQGMGIHWIITDPDGIIIENYEDWGGNIGAGQDHEFISNSQFDLDKAGKHFVSIDLLMGAQFSPIVADAFAGELCTVAAVEEEEEEGFVLIRDAKYALASTYYGNAERSTVTFSVIAPSFMLTSDKVDQMVTSFEDKFAEEGAHMLSLKLYEKSGLVQTDYSADIVTTLPTAAAAATGSTVPAFLGISTGVFYAIIIAVCLIVGLIIILVVRKDVNQFLFGTPPSNGDPGTPGAVDMIGMMITMMIVMMMMQMMESVSKEGFVPAVTKGAVKVATGIAATRAAIAEVRGVIPKAKAKVKEAIPKAKAKVKEIVAPIVQAIEE